MNGKHEENTNNSQLQKLKAQQTSQDALVNALSAHLLGKQAAARAALEERTRALQQSRALLAREEQALLTLNTKQNSKLP